MKIDVNSNLVVVDIETSGINPFSNEALAIAFVPLNEGLPTAEFFVRPESISWGVYAKDIFEGYKDSWERLAVSPVNVCDSIEGYFNKNFSDIKATLVGHNIGFDISFLRRLAFLGGRDQLSGMSHRAIDTHTLLYVLVTQGKIPESALSSDGAFRYFGIEFDKLARHTALGDAIATRALLNKIFELL